MEGKERYSWQKNEINISDYLCQLCRYQILDDTTQCKMLEEIPKEVLSNEIRCPFFKSKNSILE